MPTRFIALDDGEAADLLSRIVFAACSMGSSGRTLTTSLAITSSTRTCSAAARSGSPNAGVEERRSLSETIPTSLPSSRTGRCLMRLSLHRASAVAAVSSGESVTISRAIESFTRSIEPPTSTPSLFALYSSGSAHVSPRGWYKCPCPSSSNQFLADSATALVRESFTGVGAPWWWERRVGGGIEVCQEFDPEASEP